jgi:hypothetical protein
MQRYALYVNEYGDDGESECDDNFDLILGLSEYQSFLLCIKIDLIRYGYVKGDPFFSDADSQPN